MTIQDVVFGKPAPIDDTPPSQNVVDQALALVCLQGADDGQPKHSLGALIKGYERSIVVFVRHNHCNMCMLYLQAMAEQAALKEAAHDNPRVKVIVIGHGSHEGIRRYLEVSKHPFDMYVDEDKQLYSALGLTRRFLGKVRDDKPSYLGNSSVPGLVASAIKEMVTSGSLAWKGGDFALLGAEFVFDKDRKPIFVHRMRDTGDHAGADKLAEYAKLS